MPIEPIEQAPKKQLISKADIPYETNRFQKVGQSIGYEKTFIDEFWDDDRFWNDPNIWGS